MSLAKCKGERKAATVSGHFELRRTAGLLSAPEQLAFAVHRAQQLADLHRRRKPLFGGAAPADSTAFRALLRVAA